VFFYKLKFDTESKSSNLAMISSFGPTDRSGLSGISSSHSSAAVDLELECEIGELLRNLH